MTGIVGPNGCGKSNVVDAIRWILGEQRPTSMRGKEMTDVIFKGSTSRTGMSFAEGCVVLDNSCGTIEGHGSEVSVTRRVFKSGEGEYLIDGQQVRRSYSICQGVEQQQLQVAVKAIADGVFSNYANQQLRPGMTLDVMPPQGRFYTVLDPQQVKHYLFIAVGSGITPNLSHICPLKKPTS